MSSEALSIIAKTVFGGSLILIFYVIYRMIKETAIKAEEEEIKIGEMENENYVNSLSPDELVELINSGKEPNPSISTPPKKPNGSV